MKAIIRTSFFVLLLITSGLASKAQTTVDESNLASRLSGINAMNISDAEKYFADHKYTLFSKQTVPQPAYSMDLYKYKTSGQTSSYLLSVIAGGIVSAGYITYSEDEYQQALKSIKDAGYAPGEATTPESGKTIYAKGDLRFLIQKKTANEKVFYVIMLSDLLKTAKLSGIKK